MSLVDMFLGRQNVQQLPPEQQQQARSEATRQFLLGTLFGGRGLASGYAATQQVIPTMQAAQQRQRMEQARQQSLVPTGNFLGPQQGSQLDLLRGQMGDMINDPQADAMTTQALQRTGQGTGIGGTGLTAERQLVPEMELDPVRFAELASQAMPASDVQGILQNFEAVRPKINEQGIITDIRGRVVGSVPFFKDGTQTQLDQGSGSFVSGAVPGFREAQIRNFIPSLGEGQQPVLGPQGQVGSVMVPGFAENRAVLRTLDALSEAQGRTVSGLGPDNQPGNVPVSSIVGTPLSFLQSVGVISQQPVRQPSAAPQAGAQMGAQPQGAGQPATPAVGAPAPRQAPRPAGFVPTARTPQQEAIDESIRQDFLATTTSVREAAGRSGDRIMNAEEVYSLAETIDPSKLTDWFGVAAPYLSLIPGVGQNLDRFRTNFALFNQQYNRAVTTQMAGPAAKGNLNETEVNLFKGSTYKTSDPKAATQWIMAREIALADKDRAKAEFLADYRSQGGDPGQFENQWARSDRNPRIYNHPKVNQFITERVQEGLSRTSPGEVPEFNFPPGFTAQGYSDDRTGIVIRKPDGSTFIAR